MGSVVAAQQSAPFPKHLEVYRSLASTGQDEEAYRVLEKKFNDEKKDDNKSRMALALGILAYNKKKLDVAKNYLEQSLKLHNRLEDYAMLYLARTVQEQGDSNTARTYYDGVRKYQPVSIHSVGATHELVHIAIEQKKWNEAISYFNWLEKKGRRDMQYPEILKDGITLFVVRGQKWQACKWAQKLYSKYPADTLPLGWGFDLSKAKMNGIALGCLASPRDMEKRFRNLLIAGESEQAKIELDELSQRTSHGEKTLQAPLAVKYGELALAQGKVNDALQFFKQAKDKADSFNIEMLLGKAYSRTDDYLHAVESYLRAYHMRPKAKPGRMALFQAAFLSYQNRDYDGASRRFEEFVDKFGRTGMAADARWHLAWIRYLKSDFEGALRAFEDLSRKAKNVDLEKITYWRAMAHLRLNQLPHAKILFELLAKQRRLGYYTAAAKARLSQMPWSNPASNPNELKNLIPVALLSSATDFKMPAEATPTPGAAISASSPNVSPAASPAGAALSAAVSGDGRKPQSLSDLSDDKTVEQETESFPAPKAAEAESDEDEIEIVDQPVVAEETPPVSPFKDPTLLKRFDRATDLLALGFDEWAKMELREIEKRTSNRGYLQTLMTEYIRAGDFNRGAFIADVIFQNNRERGGFEQAMVFWTSAYPQAYSKQVMAMSRKFDVPSSLVWGIMRAESGYRVDVHSSAGALGLMQMIPVTAGRVADAMGIPNFKSRDLLNPDTNILFGTWYLRRLNKVFKDNLPLSIAAYNSGPHRVQGWMKDFGGLELDEFVEHIPYLETRNYTKKVLRHIFIYKLIYEKELNPLIFLAKKPTVKFDGPKPQKENWDAI